MELLALALSLFFKILFLSFSCPQKESHLALQEFRRHFSFLRGQFLGLGLAVLKFWHDQFYTNYVLARKLRDILYQAMTT